MKKTLALVKLPNRVSLSITSRADEERSELDDGRTPGLDAPFSLSMTAGKGEPEKTSSRPS
jgi:hypothetical protein